MIACHKQMLFLGFGLLFALVSGCGRTSGTPTDQRPGDVRITTRLSQSRITAGTALSVQCEAFRGNTPTRELSLIVRSLPTQGLGVATPGSQSGSFAFVPTVASTYQIRCQTADGAVIDAVGKSLEVSPADAQELEVSLTPSEIEAGDPARFVCRAVDRYGNISAGSTDVLLDIPASAQLVQTATGVYNVSSTRADHYDLGCRSVGLRKQVTKTFTVIAGPIARTIATLDRVAALPTERVGVTCQTADRFNNPRSSSTGLRIDVQPMSGVLPSRAGLQPDASGFSVTLADDYQVFCVPPQANIATMRFASLRVNAGAPIMWDDVLQTPDTCLPERVGLPITPRAMDAWGNVVTSSVQYGLCRVTAAGCVPQTLSTNAKGQLMINGEGDYRMTANIAGSSLSPKEMEISVDSTPPSIELSDADGGRRPVRGSHFLVTDGFVDKKARVELSWRGQDAGSGLRSMMINGRTSMGTSRVVIEQEIQWGLNTVRAEAQDDCGNRRVVYPSFLASDAYYPSVNPDNFFVCDAEWKAASDSVITSEESRRDYQVTEGITVFMSQEFLDDGVRGTVDGPALAELDDLVSVAQVMLDRTNFNTLIDDMMRVAPPECKAPSVVQPDTCDILSGRKQRAITPPYTIPAYCKDTSRFPVVLLPGPDSGRLGVEARKGGAFTYSSIKIDQITLRNGGLVVGVSMHDLRLPVDTTIQIPLPPAPDVSVDGSMVIKIKKFALTLDLGLAARLGIPAVTCRDCVNVVLECDASPGDHDCPDVKLELLPFPDPASHLINEATNIVVDSAKFLFLDGMIKDILVNTLEEQIPGRLEEMLRKPLLQSRMDICTPAEVHMGAQALAERLDIKGRTSTDDASMQLGLTVDAIPVEDMIDEAEALSFSSIKRGTSRADFSKQASQSHNPVIGLAVQDDFINRILWSMWASGGMQMDDVIAVAEKVLDKDLGVDGDISMHAGLPPVMMPGSTPDEVVFSAGELDLDVAIDLNQFFDAMDVAGGAAVNGITRVKLRTSVIFTARFHIDNAIHKLVIHPSKDPQVRVEVIGLSNFANQAALTEAFDSLMSAVIPAIIRDSIMQMDLPKIDLGSINVAPLASVPEGTLWTFSEAYAGRGEHNDHFVVTGRIFPELGKSPPLLPEDLTEVTGPLFQQCQ